MGNATTTLLVTNGAAVPATLSVTVNQPGGVHHGEHYHPKVDSYVINIGPGQRAKLEVKRNCTGSVTAQAVVSFTDGATVNFTFGVIDHDTTDNVVLHQSFVMYNGVQRGGPGGPGSQPTPQPGYPPQPSAPQPGYPAPQPGYPASQPGYPAPQPGYPAPQPGYSPAPQPGYPSSAPQPGYPAPQPGYPAPQPGYSPAPQPGYQPTGYPPAGYPPAGYPSAPQPGYPEPSAPPAAAYPAAYPAPLPAFAPQPSYPPQPPTPTYPPPTPSYSPAPVPAAGPPITPGRTVLLKSMANGQNVRITQDGRVDAQGQAGRFAQFIVSPNNGYVRFQNVNDPAKFLAIRQGMVTWGIGGAHCEFYINTLGPNLVTIKAAHEPGGLGFHGNGLPKEAYTTHDGVYGQFQVIYV